MTIEVSLYRFSEKNLLVPSCCRYHQLLTVFQGLFLDLLNLGSIDMHPILIDQFCELSSCHAQILAFS
jgi:hypothetical protein